MSELAHPLYYLSMIRDPLNELGTRDTAVIAIFLRNGKTLLGLREYVKGSPVWTSPGGRCDAGETIE